MEADDCLRQGLSPPGINLKLGPTKCQDTQLSQSFPFCPSIIPWLVLCISLRVACWCVGWLPFCLSESFYSPIIHSTFTGNISFLTTSNCMCVEGQGMPVEAGDQISQYPLLPSCVRQALSFCCALLQIPARWPASFQGFSHLHCSFIIGVLGWKVYATTPGLPWGLGT